MYSPDGRYFAYTLPGSVEIVDPSTQNKVATLELADVYDVFFLPQGLYVATWQRPVRLVLDDGNVEYSKNVVITKVPSGEVVTQYTYKVQNGWRPQFTADEQYVTRLFSNGVRFYDLSKPVDLGKPTVLLAEDGILNYKLLPGKNPLVAVFIPEKSGKPASVKLYAVLAAGFRQPLCLRLFFKAEACLLTWNALGTAVLALALTDIDSSNKLYYGESALYLLGIAGAYNLRIQLDAEAGPIHDVRWSPLSREFGVIYGFMPAHTLFFDARGNLIHLLPPNSRNTILFSPHARFVLVAGFGNLQGTVDIYDRTKKFAKVTLFEASNTLVCHWSPDGRYILTATTSPRLRVDNGIKVWHASGKLCFAEEFKELFAVDWRPQPVSEFPPLKTLENDFVVHPSAQNSPKKTEEAKPAKSGAYRPPHARNNGASATKTLYEAEMLAKVGFKPKPRVVPGAAAPVAVESKAAAKNRKKREAKKRKEEEAAAKGEVVEEKMEDKKESAGGVVGGVVSVEEKKIRSLLKKLRAIEGLKMKQASGEKLEDTQVLKIGTEDKVRAELEALGWKDDN